eukprot:Tamp_09337.p1 GENE.Tamp_09337~~Tamp_09337.p1  ORF type:complete len:433 (+),score=34.59 Tamp_09337:43-1299(+)
MDDFVRSFFGCSDKCCSIRDAKQPAMVLMSRVDRSSQKEGAALRRGVHTSSPSRKAEFTNTFTPKKDLPSRPGAADASEGPYDAYASYARPDYESRPASVREPEYGRASSAVKPWPSPIARASNETTSRPASVRREPEYGRASSAAWQNRRHMQQVDEHAPLRKINGPVTLKTVDGSAASRSPSTSPAARSPGAPQTDREIEVPGGGLRIRFEEYMCDVPHRDYDLSPNQPRPGGDAGRGFAQANRQLQTAAPGMIVQHSQTSVQSDLIFRSTPEGKGAQRPVDLYNTTNGNQLSSALEPQLQSNLRSVATVGVAFETLQGPDGNKLFVAAVRKGGPGANAIPPLLVGDLLLKIDNKPIDKFFSTRDALAMLQGPPGTEVQITLCGEGDIKDVILLRQTEASMSDEWIYPMPDKQGIL